VNFSDQPPSKDWAVLKYRGEKVAEVWFKPEGEPSALTFRIPQSSFQIPGMGQQLTAENLLKAVALAPEEVESWRQGDVSHSGMNGSNPELRNPLSPPPPDVSHLDVFIRLNAPAQAFETTESGEPPNPSPPQAVDPTDSGELPIPLPSQAVDPTDSGELPIPLAPEAVAFGQPGETEIPLATWQDLEARWKAIVGLEATLDTLRISMEGLQAEMEASLKKTLTTEEKVHALRADLAQWNKAKSRVHHAVPRVREFIHRAVWSLGTPERKHLEELYKNHIQPQIPCPGMEKVFGQLENLQKDRQILAGHGNTVYHECKSIAVDVQGALRTLQSNAAANAKNKKSATGGGKFFKHLRKWSGAG
jgi:hypothetical protein